jgi:hypothetical protein
MRRMSLSVVDCVILLRQHRLDAGSLKDFPAPTPTGFAEIVSDDFPIFHAHLNAVYVFWNPGQAGSQEIYLPSDGCRDGPGLNLCATRFFRRIQQKLAAAKINGSRPFAHAKNSLLAKACDRLILESQLTPGLDTGLHGRALMNIIVHCSRTR